MPVTTFTRRNPYTNPLCDRCGVVWVVNRRATTCTGCLRDGGEWALNHARARAMRALGLPHPWATGSAAAREATLGALRFFGGLTGGAGVAWTGRYRWTRARTYDSTPGPMTRR